LDELPLGWHVKRLVNVREWSVQAADTSWWSLKIEEAFAGNGSLQLSAETAGDWRFVGDDASTSLADRVTDGLAVPRSDGDEIDHLDGDAELFFHDASDLRT